VTNPYGYGLAGGCPNDFVALGWDERGSNERAFFDPNEMPRSASTSAHVCAAATVTDARATFTTSALAQKNPEVESAFPSLQSPVEVATPIRFMLQTCNDIVSERHRQMQLQRLRLDDGDVVCIDDFATRDFSLRLARLLQDAVDTERVAGRDMILLIGLNRRDANNAVATAVEVALGLVVDEESDQSSPRLAGAMVFDSAAHGIATPQVGRFVLWCPAETVGNDLDEINDTSLRSCAVQLDQELRLGPIRLAALPILPTRRQYETFVDRYSEGLAGNMRSLEFRAPTRTAVSDNVALGNFGVATFFNNEAITANVDDAFSFCADGPSAAVVFRIDGVPDILPIAVLADVQEAFPQPRYELGLAWDFPYYVHLEYEAFVAGAATVAGLTIPFGPGSPAEQFLGGAQWFAESVDLRDVLLRCSRFCQNPTFDSAGVYNVLSPFDQVFRNQCYVAEFPEVSDGGFPIDP
jgi:hypothetical protein